jgi:SSS family solute:Na+ symporter
MELSAIDILVFVGFIVAVVAIGTLKSSKEKTSEDYFLASRGLKWWLIGFSLIAANISTEQFVGMSGSAAGSLGLAIASYEWMAAITLVVVAFVFLPKFLRSGIYTIPEFMEYRYNETSRSIMAVFMIAIYVFVTIAAVIYSGALTINTLFEGRKFLGLFDINIVTASWIIGLIAGGYVAVGGLKACAWADLLQGSALIAGGAIVVIIAMNTLGDSSVDSLTAGGTVSGTITDASSGIAKFFALNKDKLHMVLPITNADIPWTALVIGLWIPNFYYWGLNQYITQRTLGAKSLSQGQKGIVFAAALKLIIPFIIVAPGIIAFNLFSKDMANEAVKDTKIVQANQKILAEYESAKTNHASNIIFEFDNGWKYSNPEKAVEIDAYNQAITAKEIKTEKRTLLGYKYDSAFALLIGRLIPSGRGLQGFMLAAILGAVISSLASMLNSASTIFTMDIYGKYISKQASQKNLVAVGRICVGLFMVIGCVISPMLANPEFGGIFKYIQEFQGFISPGILAVFVFGLVVKKVPGFAGVVGLLVNPLIYGVLKIAAPSLAFLDRMALSFASLLIIMAILTAIKPLHNPKDLPHNTEIDLKSSPIAKLLGIVVVAVTITLYVIFW